MIDQKMISYSNWPNWVKILTAYYFKPVMGLVKNPKTVRNLSFMSLLIGFMLLLQFNFMESVVNKPFLRNLNLSLAFLAILNILLGLLNLFYNYPVHLWVNNNSSWEERFSHKSSKKHKSQYLLIWLVLILLTIAITYLLIPK